MSDSESGSSNRSDSDDDEEITEGSQDNKEDEDSYNPENAAKDIALINDIFNHVAMVSERITERFLMKEKLNSLSATIETLKKTENLKPSVPPHSNQKTDFPSPETQDDNVDAEIADEVSISWSEYEEMDDAQRAKLLEQSLKVLAAANR